MNHQRSLKRDHIYNRLWRGLATIGALATLVVAASGCKGFRYITGTSEGSSYLLRLGGPREITDWTLKQVDEDRISDGIFAMGLFCGPSDARCAAAIAGIQAIHSKLAVGWPGFTRINHVREVDAVGPLPEIRRQENLEHLFDVVYQELVFIGSPDAADALLSMRPDAKRNPQRFQKWSDAASRCRVK